MELKKISFIESELTKIQEESNSDNQFLYLLLLGNQTEKAIRTLPSFAENISLLWDGWSGPKWMKYIFSFMAGHAGLYKFSDKLKMKELALEASIGGLVQIIKSKKELDNDLIKLLTEKGVNPQYVRDFLTNKEDTELIEIVCDREELLDNEPAGYFIKILN